MISPGQFWHSARLRPSVPLTEDLDVDRVPLALADGVDGDAGDVGLGLQRDGVDGPVAAGHVVDHVAPAHPDEPVGLGAARVVDVAGEGDGVALDHLFGVDAEERLARRICGGRKRKFVSEKRKKGNYYRDRLKERWALGCVNPASWLPLAAVGRVHAT